MTGKLHVYTGNGKGKTTAAMGLALRSLGHGRRVLIAQFLKDGRSGELTALRTFERATVYPAEPISGFVFAMTAEEKEEAARRQNAQAAEIQKKNNKKRGKNCVPQSATCRLGSAQSGRKGRGPVRFGCRAGRTADGRQCDACGVAWKKAQKINNR